MTKLQIYLASSSPRRQELLKQIGVNFRKLTVDIEEVKKEDESPELYVQRVALDKALAGWQSNERDIDIPVLGADTEVVIDNQVLGKPQNKQHAIEMLGLLSGREHRVISAVAFVQGEKKKVLTNINKVFVRDLTEQEKYSYCDTGESQDKAGGYGIQGKAAMFISHLEGSFSGIMGLPLYETSLLLSEFGIDVLK